MNQRNTKLSQKGEEEEHSTVVLRVGRHTQRTTFAVFVQNSGLDKSLVKPIKLTLQHVHKVRWLGVIYFWFPLLQRGNKPTVVVWSLVFSPLQTSCSSVVLYCVCVVLCCQRMCAVSTATLDSIFCSELQSSLRPIYGLQLPPDLTFLDPQEKII